MHYLKRTKRYVLIYQKFEGLKIIYSNSDFDGCQDRKHSMSRYIYMLVGGAISGNNLLLQQQLEFFKVEVHQYQVSSC
ncbi:hypothetical protein CR513_22572, partial [Mucuna pruriens]